MNMILLSWYSKAPIIVLFHVIFPFTYLTAILFKWEASWSFEVSSIHSSSLDSGCVRRVDISNIEWPISGEVTWGFSDFFNLLYLEGYVRELDFKPRSWWSIQGWMFNTIFALREKKAVEKRYL